MGFAITFHASRFTLQEKIMPQSLTEPLSNVDAAWLRMEDPTNLMMISGVLTFDHPIDMAHLKAVFQHRFVDKYVRFRQRVVQPRLSLRAAYWEVDPNFDLDAHIHRVALPAPGDKAALQEMASDLTSTPLDFARPLWQMHYIENYGEGCALLVRLHHCIADGMALVGVLLSLTDMSPDSPWPQPAESDTAESGGDGLLGRAWNTVTKPASTAVNVAKQAAGLTGKLVQEGRETIANPSRLLELVEQGRDLSLSAGRLVLRLPDPHTMFKGQLGVSKKVSWIRPLPLDDIKAIKNVAGGTVNDVLVSILTGALRRYLIGQNQRVEGIEFRAAIPVNLRSPEEMETMGNKFGLVFLTMPISIADSVERLHVVRERMTILKNSPEAVVAFGILNALGMTPADIQSEFVKIMGAKATAVLTNVPGPRFPLYLAGQRIRSMMVWVPQSGRLSLGLSIISYANKVFVGICADANLVPDPNSITDFFIEEYEEMMQLVEQAKTLDELMAKVAVEEKTEGEGPQTEVESQRCRATTKAGSQCKNSAQPGSTYCHIHQNSA
jgi:diacylglycerol O-acyltransferase / wax synthase